MEYMCFACTCKIKRSVCVCVCIGNGERKGAPLSLLVPVSFTLLLTQTLDTSESSAANGHKSSDGASTVVPYILSELHEDTNLHVKVPCSRAVDELESSPPAPSNSFHRRSISVLVPTATIVPESTLLHLGHCSNTCFFRFYKFRLQDFTITFLFRPIK